MKLIGNMARDINLIKKDLKTEWNGMKNCKSTEEKRPYWKRINELETEASFKVTDFEANQKAFDAKKNSNTSTETTTFTPLKEFKTLDEAQQKVTEEKARKLFEQKNIIEKIAHDEFPQYHNGASVGQVLGIINAP